MEEASGRNVEERRRSSVEGCMVADDAAVAVSSFAEG